MDTEIGEVYAFLVECNYPVTLDELKNPTSAFMAKVILTFLSGLSIDGKTIQRVTFEQIQILSYPEVCQELIGLINLHQVIVKMGDHIFTKDVHLTDITSPGAKRTRKVLRTLLNFGVYATNKIFDLAEPLENIFSKLNTLMEQAEKKNKDVEFREKTVLEKSKKAALKELYIKQIEELKSQMENKKFAAIEEQVQNFKQIKQTKQQNNGTIKQKLLKMDEKIAEMESTIVTSPEEYQARLKNYGQDYKIKKEKLEGMVEKLRAKQQLKSLFERVEEFINQEYEKFLKVQNTLNKSITLDKIKAEITKELDKEKAMLKELRDELANFDEDNHDDTAKIEEVQASCQKQLIPHHELHMKLLSQVQDVQKRFHETEVRCQQLRGEKEESIKVITNLEDEITELLKGCQDLYISDIQKEVEVQKLWKNKNNIE